MPDRQDMASAGFPGDAARLDDYLDGRMKAAERAAFERELSARPDLQAQIELQDRIDEGIRRNLGRAGRGLGRPARRGWWWYAAAAALALAALPLLWFGAKRALETELEGAYRRTVAAGFKPAEVCTTDEAFRAWVREKYKADLEPAADRQGVELVGWSYTTVLGPYSALLLARAEGRPIVVVMDRREQAAANPPSMPLLPGLKVYKREIGKLAFFEVSPLDHAAVIEVLREAPGP